MSSNRLGDLSLIIVIILLSCFLIRSIMLLSASLPISPRSIQETKGVSPLWLKEINIEPLHTSWVQFFTPSNQNVVFVSSKSLQSLDMTTGQFHWKIDVPDPISVRLYDEKIFVASYEHLQEAPNSIAGSFDCSFINGESSLSVYNPQTGEKVWGYSYPHVDSTRIYFRDRNVYLTGSANHGDDRSIAYIDADTGVLFSLSCTKWPSQPVNLPLANEGDIGGANHIVHSERDLKYKSGHPLFAAQGTRLNILDGKSKESLGYIEFSGTELNPLEIDVAVQNDLVIVYLDDTSQLFGFRFWSSFPLKN